MPKLFPLSTILLVAALGFVSPVTAQQRSAVSGSELDAAVARRPIGSRPAAPGVHVVGSPARDQAAVEQSIAQSREERDLTGGDSVVIGTTLLIIILLVVILVAVA